MADWRAHLALLGGSRLSGHHVSNRSIPLKPLLSLQAMQGEYTERQSFLPGAS